jgi:hypothetical protein
VRWPYPVGDELLEADTKGLMCDLIDHLCWFQVDIVRSIIYQI